MTWYPRHSLVLRGGDDTHLRGRYTCGDRTCDWRSRSFRVRPVGAEPACPQHPAAQPRWGYDTGVA